MATNIQEKWRNQQQNCMEIALVESDGKSKMCSSFLELSSGRKLLVTMPPVDPLFPVSSNWQFVKLNQIAPSLWDNFRLKVFVLLPSDETRIRSWLPMIPELNVFILLDPENKFSNALGITKTYENILHKFTGPERLDILFENGNILFAEEAKGPFIDGAHGEALQNKLAEALQDKLHGIFQNTGIESQEDEQPQAQQIQTKGSFIDEALQSEPRAIFQNKAIELRENQRGWCFFL